MSGEHGDGRWRAPLLPRVWPADTLERFAAVKRAFDPDAILNPGAKVAVAGAQPLGDVKYDPSLPALPEPARAALSFVQRERAYARSRLALLDEPALDGRVSDV
jgi:hypothetical protein